MRRYLILFCAVAGMLVVTSCKSSKKCGCPTFGQNDTNTEVIVCAPTQTNAI